MKLSEKMLFGLEYLERGKDGMSTTGVETARDALGWNTINALERRKLVKRYSPYTLGLTKAAVALLREIRQY